MDKKYTFTQQQYDKINNEREEMKKQIKELNKQNNKLQDEIDYMKTGKEEVLVVVKDKEKNDQYYFKTKEKDVLKETLNINKQLSDKNENYSNKIVDLKNEVQNLKGKIDDLNSEIEKIKNEKKKALEYIDKLKNRNLYKRIINKTD